MHVFKRLPLRIATGDTHKAATAAAHHPQAPPLLLAPLLLALLPPPPAAAQAAPAAEPQPASVDAGSCQSGVWHGLPLATSATPAEEYHPTSWDYYQDWALRSVLPPFVLACTAAALLLAFALWRAIKLASCVRCIRGPRHRAKAAADILGARRHRALQAAVALLAAGVVAGAGYGFSTIQPGLEPRGVRVYEGVKVGARILLRQLARTRLAGLRLPACRLLRCHQLGAPMRGEAAARQCGARPPPIQSLA